MEQTSKVTERTKQATMPSTVSSLLSNLKDGSLFGEFSRYQLHRHESTRAAEFSCWMVLDAERRDPITGEPEVIRQASTIEDAVRGLLGYPDKLITPLDITPPAAGIFDHGLTLVHEMGGAPRNYLHEVSFVDGDHRDTVRYLHGAGYSYRCGWRRREDGRQMWTFTKAFPLTVAAWIGPEV